MGLLYVLLLTFAIHTHADDGRLQAHQKAAKDFHQLNFFADGRGMILAPGLLTAYQWAIPKLGLIDKTRITDRWGMIYDDNGKIAGLHEGQFKNLRLGVLGCAGCHSGRAAGQYIIGLGNKNIDVLQLGRDVRLIQSSWNWLIPGIFKDNTYVEVQQFAYRFAQYLANENLGNLTQGLVPVSFIRGWFYRIQGMEVPDNMPKGQVKVPFLWGYAQKRKVGQFSDGYGEGTEPGWAIAVELTAGQTVETVRNYFDKVRHAEDSFEHLLPPKYPFAINETLATSGKGVFENTCAKCHGTYAKDAAGYPIYQEPKWIRWEVVRTDFDRLAGNTDAFNQLVNTNPLSDVLKIRNTNPGYFAPRLEGVWSRFPYLHNASIPTIWDLLTPETLRPKFFSLRNVGERDRFDTQRLGLTVPRGSQQSREREFLETQGRKGIRHVYSTERTGQSNLGHNFFTDLPRDQKLQIIEYLKTL